MKRIIKNFFIEIINIIMSFFAFIINIIPHDKNIILFESNSDLQDNSKALFDYMIDNKLDKKYRIIWLIRNKESKSKYEKKYNNIEFVNLYKKKDGFKYLYVFYLYSIAKYTFYTHDFIGLKNNKKQIRFFLTHAAVPIKNTKNKFWNYKNNTYILSTSEFAAFYRCLTFKGGLNKIKLLGFPRNDRLFDNNEKIKEKLEINTFDKIIIWMPTFKHHKNGDRNDYNTKTKKDISILKKENMKKINNKLKNNNMLLIIKFHPAQDKKYVQDFNDTNIKTLTNEELANKDVELYSLLGICDGLITDFSSVYFDYLLCNKPIAFELGDEEEYKKGIGFNMENPLDYMPGEKIRNIENFMLFLDNISNNKDTFKKERESLRDKVHNYLDNNSSKRIVEFLGLGDRNEEI